MCAVAKRVPPDQQCPDATGVRRRLAERIIAAVQHYCRDGNSRPSSQLPFDVEKARLGRCVEVTVPVRMNQAVDEIRVVERSRVVLYVSSVKRHVVARSLENAAKSQLFLLVLKRFLGAATRAAAQWCTVPLRHLRCDSASAVARLHSLGPHNSRRGCRPVGVSGVHSSDARSLVLTVLPTTHFFGHVGP
jgi:hypothetical protein